MVSLEVLTHLAQQSTFDSASAEDRLHALYRGTRHDACASIPGICRAKRQDGGCIRLFKTLYTNRCSHQCGYCINSCSTIRRFSYTPEELSWIAHSLYRSGQIDGLFLSSGTGRGEEEAMEGMLETARLLRSRYGFRGYIHLKILPGASLHHIDEAVDLSDRVSINIEAPSASRMSEISSTKDYERDILQRQRYISRLMERSGTQTDQTTQLVVGAGGESDIEIFERVLYEYEEMGVKRAYYSAFMPQRGTALERREPQPSWRALRLYQIDRLYRVYSLDPSEIYHAFDEDGFLPNCDPKAKIAMETLERLDVNSASYKELLRVPGIGPMSARRILAQRQRGPISSRSDLEAIGVRTRKAAPFLQIGRWRSTKLDEWSA